MKRRALVATLSVLIAALYVVWRLAASDWDPVGIFELGSQFSVGDVQGSEGYDGQFTYFIAIDPDPERVAPRLDVPAYRYQRILLPLLGRILAFGNRAWIPWALIAVNLVAHWLGTWAVCALLANRGEREWFGLGYGLWVGLVAPIGIGLAEPLAYGLVAWGLLLALDRQQPMFGIAALGLAALAKETALIYLAALLVAELSSQRNRPGQGSGRRGRRLLVSGAVVLAVYLAWQLWLLAAFGNIGLGSGGALATGFEWIPFMGLLRIGTVSVGALVVYLAIFGPSVVLPAVWGVLRSVADWLGGQRGAELYALLGNGLAIMALPFSTFREWLGVVRVADGLVLAVLLYGAVVDDRRPIRYSLFWIAWLAFLIPR